MAAPNPNLEFLLQIIESKRELGDRFTQIKRMGVSGGGGAFSIVFSAFDKTSNARVALKFFDPNVSDPYRFDSFKREADLLATLRGQADILQLIAPTTEFTEKLQHGNGFSFDLPFRYYAAELARCDLGTLLIEYEVEASDKIEMFRAMCRAVQRLHKLQIAHRDLKPSNFLVMKDGTLRLSDFGTARCLQDSPPLIARYSNPPGDLTYAPLEMIAALHDSQPTISYAGDIYALGAIIFEMFTNTPLNLQLFDPSMLTDLNTMMNGFSTTERAREFHKHIGSISNRYRLPDIRDFSTEIPLAVAPLLNRMYRELAAIDYRRRSRSFSATFLQIDQALVVLRNQAAFARWNDRKRTFRDATELKRLRIESVHREGVKQ
jgi:serine/threonine protein kinase